MSCDLDKGCLDCCNESKCANSLLKECDICHGDALICNLCPRKYCGTCKVFAC